MKTRNSRVSTKPEDLPQSILAEVKSNKKRKYSEMQSKTPVKSVDAEMNEEREITDKKPNANKNKRLKKNADQKD